MTTSFARILPEDDAERARRMVLEAICGIRDERFDEELKLSIIVVGLSVVQNHPELVHPTLCEFLAHRIIESGLAKKLYDFIVAGDYKTGGQRLQLPPSVMKHLAPDQGC
jgi:hypothetical protein